jgi:hypothetical protein
VRRKKHPFEQARNTQGSLVASRRQGGVSARSGPGSSSRPVLQSAEGDSDASPRYPLLEDAEGHSWSACRKRCRPPAQFLRRSPRWWERDSSLSELRGWIPPLAAPSGLECARATGSDHSFRLPARCPAGTSHLAGISPACAAGGHS